MTGGPPPSGIQYPIEHGDLHAVVTQVGATLRELTAQGHAVLDGFEEGQRATDGRGQVLAPWPNRLTAGRYVHAGQVLQGALTEPARSGAIHGLVRWLEWTVRERDSASVTLGCILRPQPGYEWQLDLQVGYRLAEDGLTVSVVAVNESPTAAPFGVGFHPYLTLGAPVDGLELQLPARSHLAPTDPDTAPARLPVDGTGTDFRTSRRIGATVLDTAFADLDRTADGRAIASLSEPGGRTVRLWADEAFGYLMVYTGDHVGAPERRRRSVAVEPMTCPPDAFRSGTDLILLEPGRAWRAAWGIA